MAIRTFRQAIAGLQAALNMLRQMRGGPYMASLLPAAWTDGRRTRWETISAGVARSAAGTGARGNSTKE